MNGFLRIVFAAAGALALGGGAGYVMLVNDTCRWLGSSFEGGCGYAALGYALLLGCIVAAISFALLLRFMPSIAPIAVSKETGPAPRKLVGLWLVFFILDLGIPLIVTFVPLWLFDFLRIVDDFTMPIFIIASGILAPYRGYHPAIALLALIPIAGHLIVAALLFLSKPITLNPK